MHSADSAVALCALKAAGTLQKTLMKPLLLCPFVHSIYHYTRNLRTIMMENHTERKEKEHGLCLKQGLHFYSRGP